MQKKINICNTLSMVVIFFLQCCYIHISHESLNKVFYIWCFYRYNYTGWVFHWGGKKIPVLQVQVLIPKGNRLPQSDLDTIWDRFFGIKLLMCVFELIFHKFEHPKSRYKRDTEGEHVFSVNKLEFYICLQKMWSNEISFFK